MSHTQKLCVTQVLELVGFRSVMRILDAIGRKWWMYMSFTMDSEAIKTWTSPNHVVPKKVEPLNISMTFQTDGALT